MLKKQSFRHNIQLNKDKEGQQWTRKTDLRNEQEKYIHGRYIKYKLYLLMYIIELN